MMLVLPRAESYGFPRNEAERKYSASGSERQIKAAGSARWDTYPNIIGDIKKKNKIIFSCLK